MRRFSFCLPFLLILAACSHQDAPAKHYQLAGRVVSLDSQDRVATIDAAAIPNWMEAMTMQYPVKNSSDFDHLKIGESIKATLNVRGPGDYDLTDIQALNAPTK